jgi:molybdenum cofactor cytidylyltransferase
MISGTTVPKDRADTVPAAIVAAGGEIVHFGMPVEPGNMLLLARLGEVPVIILPGCARSRRTNGLDWVLQRMLAGLPMGRAEIMAMGVGGLIRSPAEAEEDEAATCSRNRSARPPGRRVAALVLAAGSSSRMGGANKLLQPVGGMPMLRRAVNAALASRCTSVRWSPAPQARPRPASPGSTSCSSRTTPITPPAWRRRCVAGSPRCRPMPTPRWCCWPTCPSSTAATSIA